MSPGSLSLSSPVGYQGGPPVRLSTLSSSFSSSLWSSLLVNSGSLPMHLPPLLLPPFLLRYLLPSLNATLGWGAYFSWLLYRVARMALLDSSSSLCSDSARRAAASISSTVGCRVGFDRVPASVGVSNAAGGALMAREGAWTGAVPVAVSGSLSLEGRVCSVRLAGCGTFALTTFIQTGGWPRDTPSWFSGIVSRWLTTPPDEPARCPNFSSTYLAWAEPQRGQEYKSNPRRPQLRQ